VTLITKRRLFSYIIVTLLWSIVGIVNFMMLSSRNTPFTYVDITLMKSVLPVMNNYFSPLEIGAMGALLLIALVLLVVSSNRRTLKPQERIYKSYSDHSSIFGSYFLWI